MSFGAGSSQANPFACIASGIAALWGPAHGGANEAVLRMLKDIGSRDKIPEAIKRAKDKNDSFRQSFSSMCLNPFHVFSHKCVPPGAWYLSGSFHCVHINTQHQMWHAG